MNTDRLLNIAIVLGVYLLGVALISGLRRKQISDKCSEHMQALASVIACLLIGALAIGAVGAIYNTVSFLFEVIARFFAR